MTIAIVMIIAVIATATVWIACVAGAACERTYNKRGQP